nr:PREDICTED: uncharacterized protein LOC109459475 [Rhinolophus sinicus]
MGACTRAGSVLPCAHGGCVHGWELGSTQGEGGLLPQCAPPPGPGQPDGASGLCLRSPPGAIAAIKASPPASTRASGCLKEPIHFLPQHLRWTWTLRPAPALLVVPAPAPAPASARDANAPPARRAAAPQSVRNAPRIVRAKVERGQARRRRSATAPSETRKCPLSEPCVNRAVWPSATSPCAEAQLCFPLPC